MNVDDHARRAVLENFERSRIRLDHGRGERVRYQPMRCKALRIVDTDRLLVETSCPDWRAAGGPGRGTFGIEGGGSVTIHDAFPRIRNGVVTDAPVNLVIGFTTRATLDGNAGELVGAGFRVPVTPDGAVIAAGPASLAWAGVSIPVNVVDTMPRRPATPHGDKSPAELRADAWAATVTAGGSSAGLHDLCIELERRAVAERADLADYEAAVQRHNAPEFIRFPPPDRGGYSARTYRLDCDPISVRFPDGLVLIDNH